MFLMKCFYILYAYNCYYSIKYGIGKNTITIYYFIIRTVINKYISIIQKYSQIEKDGKMSYPIF